MLSIAGHCLKSRADSACMPAVGRADAVTSVTQTTVASVVTMEGSISFGGSEHFERMGEKESCAESWAAGRTLRNHLFVWRRSIAL